MTSLGDENGRKMTRISNRQVVENSQSEITRSSNRPIKSRAVHQRRFLFCYSSLPLQGSFDGDSFFSASAPRLASPFLPSSLLFLYQLLFQVKYDVFLHWLTSVRGSFLSFVREQLVVIHYMDVVRQRWNTRPLTEVSLMFLFLVLVWRLHLPRLALLWRTKKTAGPKQHFACDYFHFS